MAVVKLMSGTCMPQLGLGTWLGEGTEVKEAVKTALKSGYRHIDSAFVYRNEQFVGQAIRECIQDGHVTREQLFVVSKLPANGQQRSRVKPFLETSLRNLGLDYLDLYLNHFPVATQYTSDDATWPRDENGNLLLDEQLDHLDTWKELESCVDAGLVRNIGLSNFTSDQVRRIYNSARIKPACLQVECHIHLQQLELLTLCRELKMAFTAYSPLGSPGAATGLAKKFSPAQTSHLPVTSVLEEPVLKTLAAKYNKTTAQVALRYLVQRDVIVIPKSINPKRITENSQIFDFSLDNPEMDQIRNLDRGVRVLDFKFVQGITESKKFPF